MAETLIIDRQIPGYGRFKMASGVLDEETRLAYAELVTSLGRDRRFDVIAAIRARRVTFAAVLEDYPLKGQQRIDAAVDCRRSREWELYALLRRDTAEVKIGISFDVERRQHKLQHFCAVPLELIGTTPGTHADERSLHGRFSAHRLLGEWFRWCPEIAEWARTLTPPRGA